MRKIPDMAVAMVSASRRAGALLSRLGKARRRHPMAGRNGTALASLVGGVAKDVGSRSKVMLATSSKLAGLSGWVDVYGPTANVILDRLTFSEAVAALGTLLVSRKAARPPRHVPGRAPRPARECASPLHPVAIGHAESLARMIGVEAVDLSSTVEPRIYVCLANSRMLRGVDGAIEVRGRAITVCVWDVAFKEAQRIIECLVFMREYRRKKRRRG